MKVNGYKIKPDANLSNANLPNANLVDADLTGADLTGANLEKANLVGANLTGANLSCANLRKANLTDANLTGANLVGANLVDADLTGADLTGANLRKANLTGARMPDGRIYKDYPHDDDDDMVDDEEEADDEDTDDQDTDDEDTDDEDDMDGKVGMGGDDLQKLSARYPDVASKLLNRVKEGGALVMWEKGLLDRVRKEVDAFVDEIRSARGSDIQLAFADREEIERRAESVRQIGRKATQRLLSLMEHVDDNTLIFDKARTKMEISQEFDRIPRAMQGK